MLEVRETGGGVVFRVRVQARARKEAVGGEHGGALKVSVTAPPVAGAANAAVVALVAKRLGVARQDVSILRGESSREKVLCVRGVGPEAIRGLTE